MNKTALITGAAGLLGPMHAEALLEEGYKVRLSDIDLERTIEVFEKFYPIYGDKVSWRILDVTDLDSVISAFYDGEVDVLINNAAIDPKVDAYGNMPTGIIEDMDPADFDLGMDVAVKGTFLMCKYAAKHMKPGSVIINIGSDLSVIAPDQRIYPEGQAKPITYSAAKHAIVGMTKWLAVYLAPRGIRVNCLSPTGVFNNHPQEFVDKLSTLIPLGRMARIDEYKGAIKFLASNEASSFMTGHNLVMDGGKSVW